MVWDWFFFFFFLHKRYYYSQQFWLFFFIFNNKRKIKKILRIVQIHWQTLQTTLITSRLAICRKGSFTIITVQNSFNKTTIEIYSSERENRKASKTSENRVYNSARQVPQRQKIKLSQKKRKPKFFQEKGLMEPRCHQHLKSLMSSLNS